MKQSIVWLASYPKSGNTWVRLFVANYIVNRPDPLPINQIHKFGIGDSIAAMYSKVAGRTIGVNDVALSLQLRDRVLAGVVANNADINLVKTHNRRTVAHGVQMIPEKFTRSAIYVMRNPLDMVLSYARHYGIENAEATGLICHTDNANAPTDRTVAEFLGSWSDHVESWTGKSAYPVLVLRYEDMLSQPETEFAKVVEHFGMDVDEERLQRAIQHASFDQLKQQEQQHGFNEASDKGAAFFGKGRAGQWRDELDPVLVKQIRQANKRVMKQYGYWNE
jgi:hypothetical protein